FLGGEMRLNKSLAETAIETVVGRQSKLSVIEAAAGIYNLVNENMAAAGRIYIADKGKAAGDLTLVASGGAGPAHAVDLARKLGVRRVIVPPFSGVMSSLGLLAAPIAFERSRTLNALLDHLNSDDVERIFEELERAASMLIPQGHDAQFSRSVDLRYRGQDYPLSVSVARPTRGASAFKIWADDFLNEYENLYGVIDEDNV